MKKRAERENPKSKKNVLTVVLISIIIILLLVLGYGIYSGTKVKAEVKELNSINNQLNIDKEQLNAEIVNLTYQRDVIQQKYDLLYKDVQSIYKTCIVENACKGRLPGVTWYCNNLGDEVSDPSHTCICDSSCNLKATWIK
jgi:hypothetical protein